MLAFPSPTKNYHHNSYPAISPTRPELSAKGKNVLVTGGGTGIGAAIAHAFAEAGASRIAILGRREQPLLDTKASIEKAYPGTNVFAVPTDITNQSQVSTAFVNFLGNEKLHVLISNAAVMGSLEGMRDVDPDEFLGAVHQNLACATYLSKALFQYGATDAVVVNVSSNAQHVNFGPGLSSYNVSKQAVYRLWDCVGFANPEMSIFHIQPGVVDTDMNRRVDGIKVLGQEDHSSLPANFSVWLASPEARFLKGKFLWANWDVEELKSQAEEIENGEKLNIGLVGWPFGNPKWMDGFGQL